MLKKIKTPIYAAPAVKGLIFGLKRKTYQRQREREFAQENYQTNYSTIIKTYQCSDKGERERHCENFQNCFFSGAAPVFSPVFAWEIRANEITTNWYCRHNSQAIFASVVVVSRRVYTRSRVGVIYTLC